MAQKTFNTRVRNKCDTSTNWNKATNFVPLQGELIVYSDLLKMKVGDGVTTVINLPFVNDPGYTTIPLVLEKDDGTSVTYNVVVSANS